MIDPFQNTYVFRANHPDVAINSPINRAIENKFTPMLCNKGDSGP
jgi:hypothetical protein